jgi:glutamate N-acetyltransferase/amino-acid N-acetyltransferase
MTNKFLPIKGVEFATLACGIKNNNIEDLLLVTFAKESTIAGAFSSSAIVSETINWDKKLLSLKKNPQALIVNSGNANSFTGSHALKAIKEVTKNLANKLAINQDQIYVSSTGVIGQKLPYDKIIAAMPQAIEQLSEDNIKDAAKAIMTTDTKPKMRSIITYIGDEKIVISVIAKGAGMVAPNLATMLSYIFTDAAINQDILQAILAELIEDSFNACTIDGDMSTNDTVLFIATGMAKNKIINKKNDQNLELFIADLKSLLINICDDLVSDGEGVNKVFKVHISGAKSKLAAKNVAFSIANSPLVKTAIHGADPNWGRIVMAVGKAKEKINLAEFSLAIGNYNIVSQGELNNLYDEKNTTAIYMKDNKLIDIFVDLGMTKNSVHNITVTSCDLSKGYIDINADYRS